MLHVKRSDLGLSSEPLPLLQRQRENTFFHTYLPEYKCSYTTILVFSSEGQLTYIVNTAMFSYFNFDFVQAIAVEIIPRPILKHKVFSEAFLR